MGLEKISEIRKQKGMTLEELSRLSGTPISTIKKISAGITTNPNLETVKSLAKALGCSLDDLDDDPQSMPFNHSEQEIIKKYRVLDQDGKGAVDRVLDYEVERMQRKQVEQTEPADDEELVSYRLVARNNGNNVHEIKGKKFDISKVEGLDGEDF